MKTRYNLKNEVINEIHERRSSEWMDKSYDAIIDYMHWVVDNSVPIYTVDLLEVALTNLRIATVEPTNVPEDHVDPIALIRLNIYELLCEEVQERYDLTWWECDDI